MVNLFLVNSLVAIAVVLVHYECLYRLPSVLLRLPIAYRLRVLVGVFGALTAHTLEVWMFGIVYYYLNKWDGWGHFEGNFDGSLLDCVYFSFTTYTTLGFGDIEAIGDLRFLTGIEALIGLVLITWSASFLFLEMQRYWHWELDKDQ